MGRDSSVVLDPKRNFGQPIACASGVPTQILVASRKANGSVKAAAQWYEVPPDEINDAEAFEDFLVAA